MTVQDLLNLLGDFPADATINVMSDVGPEEDHLLSANEFRCYMDCSKHQINISL